MLGEILLKSKKLRDISADAWDKNSDPIPFRRTGIGSQNKLTKSVLHQSSLFACWQLRRDDSFGLVYCWLTFTSLTVMEPP